MPFARPYPPPRRRRQELIAFRKRKNLSQREAALLAGIAHMTWHFIETGVRNPSIKMARRLAKFTRIPAARLLDL